VADLLTVSSVYIYNVDSFLPNCNWCAEWCYHRNPENHPDDHKGCSLAALAVRVQMCFRSRQSEIWCAMGLHERWLHPEVEPRIERKPTDAARVAEEAEDCVDLEAKRWGEDTLEKRIVNEREYRDSNNGNSLSHPRTSWNLSHHGAPCPFFVNLTLYLLHFLISSNMLRYICPMLLSRRRHVRTWGVRWRKLMHASFSC
jgi:hypothetical protein